MTRDLPIKTWETRFQMIDRVCGRRTSFASMNLEIQRKPYWEWATCNGIPRKRKAHTKGRSLKTRTNWGSIWKKTVLMQQRAVPRARPIPRRIKFALSLLMQKMDLHLGLLAQERALRKIRSLRKIAVLARRTLRKEAWTLRKEAWTRGFERHRARMGISRIDEAITSELETSSPSLLIRIFD